MSNIGPQPVYESDYVMTMCTSQAAWNAGYDRAGCEQLGGCLAGKSTWIGPTEVVALLRYFGLRAVIVSVRGEHGSLVLPP